MPARRNPIERFMEKVSPEPNSGCWLWIGSLKRDGYGQFWFQETMARAHRAGYILLVGPINPDLQLDHLCRVKSCVNPAHLEQVTASVNSRRGGAGQIAAARNLAKTHCTRGHEYAGDNLYVRKTGFRDCRACARERDRKRYGLRRQSHV